MKDDINPPAIARDRSRRVSNQQEGKKEEQQWDKNMPTKELVDSILYVHFKRKLKFPPTDKAVLKEAAGLLSMTYKIKPTVLDSRTRSEARGEAYNMPCTGGGGGAVSTHTHDGEGTLDDDEDDDDDDEDYVDDGTIDSASTSSSSSSESSSSSGSQQQHQHGKPVEEVDQGQKRKRHPASQAPSPTTFVISKQVLDGLLKHYQCPGCLLPGCDTTHIHNEGLHCTYTLTCRNCKQAFATHLTPESLQSSVKGKTVKAVNYCAVAGITKVAKSREHVNWVLGALGLSPLSRLVYDDAMDFLTDIDSKLVQEAFDTNIRLELKLSQEKGVALAPLTTTIKGVEKQLQAIHVAFDGNWATRGYHSNHGFADYVYA